MSEPVFCLDDGIGCIELNQHVGDDAVVVHSAQVSFAREKNEIDHDRLVGLINFMMKNHHGSVFEHCSATFLVKAPIFVVREWHRHRTQSYNEWSGRYSVLEPEFYIPNYIRQQTGKPGAYTFEEVTDSMTRTMTRDIIRNTSEHAYGMYEGLLASGIAKEQARVILPVNIYTKFYATANLRNWLKFLELRNSKHAMYEIRQYAKAIEEILFDLYPVTVGAWIGNGRVAP